MFRLIFAAIVTLTFLHGLARAEQVKSYADAFAAWIEKHNE